MHSRKGNMCQKEVRAMKKYANNYEMLIADVNAFSDDNSDSETPFEEVADGVVDSYFENPDILF